MIVTKFSGLVGSFMLDKVLKFGEISSRGFGVMAVKSGDVLLPQIFGIL